MTRILTVAAVVVSCFSSIAYATEVTTYTYDSLGRLRQGRVVGDRGSGVQHDYVYDGAGNRSSVTALAASNPRPTTITPTSSTIRVTGAGGAMTLNVGGATAGGSISITVNGVFVGTVTVSNGQATITLPRFSTGAYTVVTRYSGDANNDPGSSSFVVNIRDLSWLPAVLDLLLNN